MGNSEYRQDVDRVHKFCNSRGYGAAILDMLLEKIKDRSSAYDKLHASDEVHRFTAVTDEQLQRWVDGDLFS